MPECDLSLLSTGFCLLMFFVAGLIDSIAGGGGLISLTTLLVVGLPPHAALGTNKLALCMGTVSAFVSYLKKGQIVTGLIAVGFFSSAIGGITGSWLAVQLNPVALGRLIVTLLPVGLGLMLFSGVLKDQRVNTPQVPHLIIRGLLVGLSIGFYDGVFGPGTGSFFIIGLFLFAKLNLVKASATAKVFNLGSNAGAVLTFANGGTILYSLAIPLAIACIAGNILGTHLAVKLGARLVRCVLYGMLLILSVTLFYRFFLV